MIVYRIEKTADGSIFVFNNIDLKLRVVDDGRLKNIYINYNGYNPLFTMLIGEFSAECELDSIQLDVKSEIKGCTTACMLLYQKKSWIYLLKVFIFL